ncbi:imidazole glycerol phosphate synthase subunit HisF [Devosia insulae DS-56]|uniref:Imidazole glycerol phosphate synthase subunit HisF n=1 Tax=Devosia insulae DS-56 TaxID=1116389 RepID=A0A1E5XJ82_9HYPH|nr:AglZ/HisF2 family acetamidino modification protein [Devosia insulae]OEO28645.1 imidazole glycerol phosphate synthase subunit HisF [Devosia insulae DS-56]
MLRPRLIPCLLLRNGGLVKTRQFRDATYVGDPINAVRIFNEKEVDELLTIDIDATVRGQEPNYDLISQLAAECRMPLTYGGGVATPEQVQRIIKLGVEKVALSSAVIANPALIQDAARIVGSQSIAVVADVRRRADGSFEAFTHSGTRATGKSPEAIARLATEAGAGEFIVNDIDRDGMLAGYDLALVARCRAETSLPMTILGGAASLDDMAGLFAQHPIIGAAAGSLFVFKGKYRAVLINYPDRRRKEALLSRHHELVQS